MSVVLNVKAGQRLTFRDATGAQVDAEVVEFPKIIRVKTADGILHDIRPEDVLAEEPGKVAGRYRSRFQKAML